MGNEGRIRPMTLLAVAAGLVGSSNPAKIRQALEDFQEFSGVMKDYNPSLSKSNHDALSAEDFGLARYRAEGGIELVNPLTQ